MASAPIERPWKAPSVAMILVRPVSRVILNAASLASVPELVKNTLASGRPVIAASRLGQRHLGRGGEEVRDVPEGGDLAGDGGEHRRVGVPERVHRDAGEQVEVAAAVGVPDVAALAADEDPLGLPKVFITLA